MKGSKLGGVLKALMPGTSKKRLQHPLQIGCLRWIYKHALFQVLCG
jgi:hypothetical protein